MKGDPWAKSMKTAQSFRQCAENFETGIKNKYDVIGVLEFGVDMDAAVEAYNAAMIVKYPYLTIYTSKPQRNARCIGSQSSGDINSCPYQAEISHTTTQLRSMHGTLQLQSRCVHCNAERNNETAATAMQQKESEQPGICKAAISCTEPRVTGKRYCEEHDEPIANFEKQRRSKHHNAVKLWRQKFESSKAQGPCRGIHTSPGLWEYMEQEKGRRRLSSKWREVKSMEQQQSEILFYIDTEFAGDVMIELGVENAAGRKIVDTLVSHDKSWRELYEEGHDGTKLFMDLQKEKFEWDTEWNMPPDTQTLDARQIASFLLQAEINHPGAEAVEFSRGIHDVNKLRRFLCDNGGLDWVLGDLEGVGLMPLWVNKLPGFWHVGQALIFQLLHPDQPLAYDAHRAFVDVQKLHILFNDLIADSAP